MNNLKKLQEMNIWERGIKDLNTHHAGKSFIGGHNASAFKTQEEYDKYLKQLEKGGMNVRRMSAYKFNEVRYDFNSLGFRSDEFASTDKTKIAYLGCSFTEGFGVNKEDTWGWQFKELYEKKTGESIGYYNLGCSGWSIDRSIRALYLLINEIGFKPDYVVFLCPPPLREEACAADFDISEIPRIFGFPEFDYREDPQARIFNSQKITATRKRNLLIDFQLKMVLFDQICKLNNIKYLWGLWSPDVFSIPPTSNDLIFQTMPSHFVKTYVNEVKFPCPQREFGLLENPSPIHIALDLMHPGPNHYKVFAKKFFERFESLYVQNRL